MVFLKCRLSFLFRWSQKVSYVKVGQHRQLPNRFDPLKKPPTHSTVVFKAKSVIFMAFSQPDHCFGKKYFARSMVGSSQILDRRGSSDLWFKKIPVSVLTGLQSVMCCSIQRHFFIIRTHLKCHGIGGFRLEPFFSIFSILDKIEIFNSNNLFEPTFSLNNPIYVKKRDREEWDSFCVQRKKDRN